MALADDDKIVKRLDLDRPLSFNEMDGNWNELVNIINDIHGTGGIFDQLADMEASISTEILSKISNVDNTSDLDKPISIATQTALNLKANLNSPTFTGTVKGITKSMVGLGNVDNTSDVNKPISTSTQNALDALNQAITTAVQAINDSFVGEVSYFARTTPPSGWLVCDGRAVSRATYSKLFAAIGTIGGTGDGVSTFNLPDLRDEFIRGSGTNRAVGSKQSYATEKHKHTVTLADNGNHTHTITVNNGGVHGHSAGTGEGGWHNHGVSSGNAGSHVHGVPRHNESTSGPSQFGEYIMREGGRYSNQSYVLNTNAAGDHNHPIYINAAGTHTHGVSVYEGGNHNHGASSNSTGSHNHTVTVGDFGTETETRPRNIALLPCIRF